MTSGSMVLRYGIEVVSPGVLCYTTEHDGAKKPYKRPKDMHSRDLVEAVWSPFGLQSMGGHRCENTNSGGVENWNLRSDVE